MMWENTFKATVLSMAANSRSVETFEAVVAALVDKLTPAKVKVWSFTSLVPHLTFYGEARWRTQLGPWDRNVIGVVPRTR